MANSRKSESNSVRLRVQKHVKARRKQEFRIFFFGFQKSCGRDGLEAWFLRDPIPSFRILLFDMKKKKIGLLRAPILQNPTG